MAALARHVVVVVVVAMVAVSQSGAWQNLPRIPAGRRAQYYLLLDSGAYKYGFDTGAGHSALAEADPGNEVSGQFSFVGADGRTQSTRYTAGQGGYVPQLDGAAPTAGSRIGQTPSGISAPAPYTGAEDGSQDPDYDANADASYSFNIDTDSYKRSEQSDARGNIKGQYSYSSAVGGDHALSYVAGEGTGFVVTGSSSSGAAGARTGAGRLGSPAPAPAAAPYSGPASNAQGGANPDGSYSFSFGTNEQSRQESADSQNNVRGSYSFRTPDDGQTRRVDYEAGSATGFVAHGDHLPVAPSVPSAPGTGVSAYSAPTIPSIPAATPYSGPASNAQGGANADGSYSFSFGTNEQSRQESADSQNNVRGSYSFRTPDDGQTRRVDYEAGSATGFVARGDHLPVAPSVPSGPSSGISAYSAPASPTSGAPTPYSGPASNAQGGANPDGSYSFSFGTNEQSRQESADSQNNVRGSFSFTAPDDGQTRTVDYEAGSATGFVARGSHLPVAPSIPSGSSAPGSGISAYSSPSIPSIPAATPYSGPASNTQGGANPDGSYSFSFSTDEQSRQESADAQNNVRGSYSFRTPGDGQTRRVDYEAGSATGFVARGDHLPVAPSVPSAPGSGVSAYSAPSIPYAPSIPSATPYSGPASNAQGGANPDGSYSFSFSTNEQSRQESADAQNNVRGSYSFRTPDDGQTRRVDYEAGSATGFVARGDHLPVAPSVPSAPGSGVSAYSAPSIPSIPSATPYSGPASNAQGGANADGSYSFSFGTNEQSRQESADSQNNVRGSYSFRTPDDGQTRRVDYEAGSATGFVARGDHLPVAPSVPSGASSRLGSGAPGAPGATGASGISEPSSNGDASYSYNYRTDSSSKSESSDARGNVRGQFTYVAGDGVTRSLSYTAGGEQGFVPSGDHLPVAPSAPSGPSAPSVAVARVGSSLNGGAGSGFVVNQYLPPQSPKKYGYIYDTKA